MLLASCARYHRSLPSCRCVNLAGNSRGVQRYALPSRGPVPESDLSFQFDQGSVELVVIFLILSVPLLTRLLLATGKRESRLRAAVTVKRLKKEIAAAPGDTQLLRSLREAEAQVVAFRAEEDDLRSVRLLGGPVIMEFGLLDTVEIQELRCQLAGLKPVRSRPPDMMANITLVGLLLLIVPYFFLMLTDPTATSSSNGLGL
mmetsp:Transcript_38889/g.82773  ORF Transcript_38889/g.82773 Transcript_38889/m.82773 type:complete len:202 (+) Transcript_38889:76-681(+)